MNEQKDKKIQEYVLIPRKRLKQLNITEQPQPDETILDQADSLPKQYKAKAKSFLKWLLLNADKKLFIDSQNLLHVDGKIGDHFLDYIRYVTSPIKLKNQPRYIKPFYSLIKAKNVPKYFLVQDKYNIRKSDLYKPEVKKKQNLNAPEVRKKQLNQPPGIKRIRKWISLKQK